MGVKQQSLTHSQIINLYLDMLFYFCNPYINGGTCHDVGNGYIIYYSAIRQGI